VGQQQAPYLGLQALAVLGVIGVGLEQGSRVAEFTTMAFASKNLKMFLIKLMYTLVVILIY